MKKLLAVTMAATMLFSTAAIAAPKSDETENEVFFPTYEQMASAILDQGENEVKVVVDLTGGWSVEFAPGAVYLTNGTASEDTEADAMAITLEEEVFSELMEDAIASESYREYAHCFSYVDENEYTNYFYKPGPGCYMLISVRPGEDADEIVSRFSMEYYGPDTSILETEADAE